MKTLMLLATLVLLAACTSGDCFKGTAPLDPGWEAKWKEQNDGDADWFWCECHTAVPLEPSAVKYGLGPAPVRHLEDGFGWGLGQWIRISIADMRLMAGAAPPTPLELAKKDFEWRAVVLALCTTRAACYDLLHMTPAACVPDGAEVLDGGAHPGDVIPPGTTPPGTGPGSSGDYP